MPQIRAISYGGGVQSTAMLVLAASREIDFPLALFANTGDDSEHPDTLAYFRDVAAPYAVAHGIELVELRRRKRDGSVETLMGRLTDPTSSVGIPVRMSTGAPGNRNCTIDFKIKVIAKELKRRGATPADPAVCALGISMDEFHRMRSNSGIPYETLAYPLIERNMTRQDCVNLIASEGLPVPPKSSCWFCPYHTLGAWRVMARKKPDLFARSVALERMLNDRRTALGKDAVFLTSRLIPLGEAISDDGQMDLFPESCDIGGYCHA